MRKASRTIPEMISRFDQLVAEGELLAGTRDGEQNDCFDTIMREMFYLEARIVAAPAQTAAELEAKKRWIRESRYVIEDGGPGTGNLASLVEEILRGDAERIYAVFRQRDGGASAGPPSWSRRSAGSARAGT